MVNTYSFLILGMNTHGVLSKINLYITTWVVDVPAAKQPLLRRNFKAQRRAERFSSTELMWSSILEPDIRGASALGGSPWVKSGERDLWTQHMKNGHDIMIWKIYRYWSIAMSIFMELTFFSQRDAFLVSSPIRKHHTRLTQCWEHHWRLSMIS